MAEDDEMTMEELNQDEGGNSDEEDAANFLKTFGQTSAADLAKASLLNQWRVCEHLTKCKRSMQAAALAIYASKAMKSEDLAEIQQAAGDLGNATGTERAGKLADFKET